MGIDKNHLNTSYVKILGHLDNFVGKIWPFFVIFGHFGLYNYIGENAGRASYPVIIPLAFTTITPEPLVRFRKFWAFRKEEIKGYHVSKLHIHNYIKLVLEQILDFALLCPILSELSHSKICIKFGNHFFFQLDFFTNLPTYAVDKPIYILNLHLMYF